MTDAPPPEGPDPSRLEQLDEHIAEVRGHLEGESRTDEERRLVPGGDEPRFIDRGDVATDAVDDTIAPPG